MQLMLNLTKIGLILLAIAYVMSLFGKLHFMLDNLSSFKVHFAIAFSVCCGVFLVARQTRWFRYAAVGVLASSLPVIYWYLPSQTVWPSDYGNAIKVMSVNVSPRNNSPSRLVNLVAQELPDVLGLIELNPEFSSRLSDLRAEFPHYFEAPLEGFWGLGIYSELPLLQPRMLRFDDDLPPAVSAIVEIGETDVEFILVHPFPPMTAELANDRNRLLDLVANYVARSGNTTIVLTDLNIAMWSPYYREFIEASGLVNARKGFGAASTWPATRILGVPIDHVLHSKEIHTREFRVLPRVGSDHLPVIAELSLISPQSVESVIELGSAQDATDRER